MLGDGVEAAVQLKHRRRMTRLGWERLYQPTTPGLFAEGDPPPRDGCELEVLIDGAEALPVMAEAIANAKHFVHVTGWHLEPAFVMRRGHPEAAIGVLLAEMAERVDVRVLVWSGAPIPLFHPSRSEVKQALANLTQNTRIRAHGDPREHPFHCHHEKTIIIDGRARVRRRNRPHRQRRRSLRRRSSHWRDAGSAGTTSPPALRGPAVADVNDHFRMRWRELTGEDIPETPPPPARRQLHRAGRAHGAEEMYDALPRGEFRIFESYCARCAPPRS